MVQEARLSAAQGELSKAQGELDAKEKELAFVREKFDNAMKEKQVKELSILFEYLIDSVIFHSRWATYYFCVNNCSSRHITARILYFR